MKRVFVTDVQIESFCYKLDSCEAWFPHATAAYAYSDASPCKLKTMHCGKSNFDYFIVPFFTKLRKYRIELWVAEWMSAQI